MQLLQFTMPIYGGLSCINDNHGVYSWIAFNITCNKRCTIYDIRGLFIDHNVFYYQLQFIFFTFFFLCLFILLQCFYVFILHCFGMLHILQILMCPFLFLCAWAVIVGLLFVGLPLWFQFICWMLILWLRHFFLVLYHSFYFFFCVKLFIPFFLFFATFTNYFLFTTY